MNFLRNNSINLRKNIKMQLTQVVFPNLGSFSLGFMIGIGLALRSRVSFSQEKFWTSN